VCLSQTHTILREIWQFIDKHKEVVTLRNGLAAGDQPLRDTYEVNADKLDDALERARKLHQNGLLYSTDFSLRHGQKLGEDSSISSIAGSITITDASLM
jgi:hypothetical protein